MASALDYGSSAPGYATCSWVRHLTLTVPPSTQVYKWVSYPGGVEIFLDALYYLDKLRPNGLSRIGSSYAHFLLVPRVSAYESFGCNKSFQSLSFFGQDCWISAEFLFIFQRVHGPRLCLVVWILCMDTTRHCKDLSILKCYPPPPTQTDRVVQE